MEEFQRLIDRQSGQRRQVALADEDVARAAVQSFAVAVGAGPLADELGQFLAHGRRFGFAVAPFQVRHDALETVLARDIAARFGQIAKRDLLVAGAVQHGVADAFGKLFPRRVDVEFVMPRQRQDHLEVVHVAAIPAAHRAGGETEVRMHDHARSVEDLGHAKAVAGAAGAHRRIEREQARFEFGQRVVADRAGIARGKQRRFCVRIVHVGDDGDAVAEA